MVDPDSIVIVKGRVVRRNYVADPKRAPVILELFALAEQGLGDATVSRRLNQLGHRRKSGEPFDRRCVQDIICRPMYCGIHSTAVEGEVVLYPATDTKPLITIERWEAIMAARKQRDVSKSGREGGVANAKGRSTIHFALSRLARCGRCGRGMRCKPDSYVRKDGTKKRYYQCKGRADGAGVCDQPMIDAKAVDTMLIYHLRDYFQDAGVWYESLRNATNLDADVVQQEVSALEAELADIAKAERRGRLKWRNLTASDDPGDEAKADAVVDALAEGTRRAGAASGELDAARARLAALRRATQPTDAMLAYWTRMSEALFGRIKPDSPMGDVNRELHVALDHVVLDTVEETITIQAVQKTTGEVFDAVQVIRGSGNDGTLANVVQVPFVISLDGQVTSMAHGLNPDTVRYEVREPAVPQPPSPDRVAALLQEVGNSWEPWHWGYVHGC
jgi:hypothetical protein